MSEDTMVVNGATYPVEFRSAVVKNAINVDIKGCAISDGVMYLMASDGVSQWSMCAAYTQDDLDKTVDALVDRLVQKAEATKNMAYVREIQPKVEEEIDAILKKYGVRIQGNYECGVDLWFPYEPFSFDPEVY